VNDASAWFICKLNMLLLGAPCADSRLEDTLLHPQQREAGELAHFDRDIPQHHALNRVRAEFLATLG
jgi:type I restriction enzyme M protein